MFHNCNVHIFLKYVLFHRDEQTLTLIAHSFLCTTKLVRVFTLVLNASKLSIKDETASKASKPTPTEYHKLDGRVWWVWCFTWARMTEEAKMEAIQAVLKYSWNSNCRPAWIILWNKDVRHSTCVSNLETSASSFNKPLLYSQLQLQQYYVF